MYLHHPKLSLADDRYWPIVVSKSNQPCAAII